MLENHNQPLPFLNGRAAGRNRRMAQAKKPLRGAS